MSYSLKDFENRIKRMERFYSSVPNRAATIAVAFSKERFRAQAWVNDRTEPWKPRKDSSKKSRGRAVLVSSGRLRRSIRKVRVGPTFAVIGTDVPYASAHNYGYRGKVTVKGHRRRKTKSVKEGAGVFSVASRKERMRTVRQDTGSTTNVKSFTRNVTLPRRQFLGESRVLAQRIERDLASQVIKALKTF